MRNFCLDIVGIEGLMLKSCLRSVYRISKAVHEGYAPPLEFKVFYHFISNNVKLYINKFAI